MRIQGSKASVRAKDWKRGGDELSEDYLPYITLTEPWDPVARRAVRAYIDQDMMTVQPVRYGSVQGIGVNAAVAVDAGEVWEIVQIIGSCQMDPNVGNRTCNITVDGYAIAPAAVVPLPGIDLIATTGIVLTADQLGGSILPEGIAPNLVTNTNGVLAVVADENFVPMRLNAGAVITHANDNFAVGVGDIMEIGVHYRRVA